MFVIPIDPWSTDKCRHCGYDKFYLDRRRQWRTDYCDCGGYHYRHRIGSTYCEHNPNYQFNVRVYRHGEDKDVVLLDIAEQLLDAAIEAALKSEPKDEECPF